MRQGHNNMKKPLSIVVLLFLFLVTAFTILIVINIVFGEEVPKGQIRFPDVPVKYRSALEAYKVIEPAMHDWAEDAFVTNLSAPYAGKDTPEWGVQADGRIAWWIFTIVSPSKNSVTQISLIDDHLVFGIDGIPENERVLSRSVTPIPIEEMLDSTYAIMALRELGIEEPLFSMGTGRDHKEEEGETFIWVMQFRLAEGGLANVCVDAVTSEVVCNEFQD